MPITEHGVDVVRHSEQRFDAGHGFYKGLGVTPASSGARDIGVRRGQSEPGEVGVPHFHPYSQTVNFILRGQVVVYFGSDLGESVVLGPGDFVYFDRGAIHQPINPSAEPFEFIQVRDTATDPYEDFVVADVEPRDLAAARARL